MVDNVVQKKNTWRDVGLLLRLDIGARLRSRISSVY